MDPVRTRDPNRQPLWRKSRLDRDKNEGSLDLTHEVRAKSVDRRRSAETRQLIRQSLSSPPDSDAHRCRRRLPTPAMTANAQPLAITIQPAPSAFERLSKTFATTPSPNKINTSVPMNSPKHFPTCKDPFSEPGICRASSPSRMIA